MEPAKEGGEEEEVIPAFPTVVCGGGCRTKRRGLNRMSETPIGTRCTHPNPVITRFRRNVTPHGTNSKIPKHERLRVGRTYQQGRMGNVLERPTTDTDVPAA